MHDILDPQSDAPSEHNEHDTSSELSESEAPKALNYATISNIRIHHDVSRDKAISYVQPPLARTNMRTRRCNLLTRLPDLKQIANIV